MRLATSHLTTCPCWRPKGRQRACRYGVICRRMESPRAGTNWHVPERCINQRGSACHNCTVGPKGPAGQSIQDQDAGAQGRPQRRGVCTRVHTVTPRSRTRPCARSRVWRLTSGVEIRPISRRGPQPPGALDCAGAWWACEGPARCSLQDYSRRARHLRCSRPQAGRSRTRQEGELMPRKGPAERRELVPTRFTSRPW